MSDLPTIIFGADVTHPQPGEDSSPSIAAVCSQLNDIFTSLTPFMWCCAKWLNKLTQVVASMDWPEVTKYRGLVSAQHHREEIIQDLYKTTADPHKGVTHGGMIR